MSLQNVIDVKMRINLDWFIILCDLFKSVPVRTPKRLNVIYSIAEQICDEFEYNDHPYSKEEICIEITRGCNRRSTRAVQIARYTYAS